MALPGTATRHMINRFSYGYTATVHKAVDTAGGPTAWFEAQLHPSRVSDKTVDALAQNFPYLRSSPEKRRAAAHAGRRNEWEQAMDLVRWTILRRMTSKRQLQEMMVEFWSNLLHVPAFDDGWMFRVSYDKTIRKYALGSFADLLVAATRHPAMQVFLTSAGSTKTTVNENHGRELLELHTVGLAAGYTEAMVKDSARILTGYEVETWEKAKQIYHPRDHYVGSVQVLDFHSANTDPDGRAVLVRYLRYLAGHPATARRLATRLCRRFVSDTPSEAIVDAVATAYTASGTSIPAALRALVRHRDFAPSVDQLTRTPGQDAIATYRSLAVKAKKPKKSGDFVNSVVYVLDEMGEAPFMWPAPNGFPDGSGAWASVGRIRSSWDMHVASAGGWWPSTGFSRTKPLDLMPTAPYRFDDAIDVVARRLLGRKATADMVSAAAQLADLDPTATIRRRTDLGEWQAILMVSAVLNSPEQLRK